MYIHIRDYIPTDRKVYQFICMSNKTYRKNWRRYFFSTNTLKKGHTLRGFLSSPSSSPPPRFSSGLPPDSSTRSEGSFAAGALLEPRLCVGRRGDTALRFCALLDSLLRRESVVVGRTLVGEAEDMAQQKKESRRGHSSKVQRSHARKE